MKNKKVKIGGALLLVGVLGIGSLKLPSAYAALPVDKTQKGTIEFQLAKNVYQIADSDADQEGGDQPATPNYDEELKAQELNLSLYQVAEIQETGTYTVTSNFQSMSDSIAGISDQTPAADWTSMAEAAEEIVEKDSGITGTPATKDAGAESTTVSNLALGLYLVTVKPVTTDTYIYTFNPYLISVPNNLYSSTQDDKWIYSLTGTNAVGLKPERTTRLGDLVIEKNLTSYNASLGGANFIYDVKVEALDGTISTNVYKLSFDRAGSDSLKITDLPAGATVTVTERYTGSSYSLTTEASQTTTITANPASDEKALGEETFQEEDETYIPASVSFTNTYDKRQNGGSSVVNTFYKDGNTVDWKNDLNSAEVN